MAVSELHHRRDDAAAPPKANTSITVMELSCMVSRRIRGSAEGLSLLVHLAMARLVGLIDLQGGQTLQVLKERAAKIGVSSPIPAP